MAGALTTTEELQEYLTKKDIPAAFVTPLSGGTANFVWRLTTLLGRTSIIKHAEPYIASNSTMVFPVERMDFEKMAMETVGSILPNNGDVRIPVVLHYDSDAHVLQLSDGGPRTLKEAYTDESVDIKSIGVGLGKWIAQLHFSTTDETVRHKFDNKTAKYIYRHSYNNLTTSLKEYGYDTNLGSRINERFGSLLASDDVSVCHGDFWPGNILLSDTTITSSDPEPVPLVLSVVDWELTRNGSGVTDVGQFAAEAFLLDHCRGGRGLLHAFLNEYLGQRKGELSREDARRIAVHFGTHIAYWPSRVEWGDKEQTKQIVGRGVEVLEHAEKGNWEWLRGSVLGVLFAQKK
ncbi:hypothetical protein EJ08DRAFT_487149 [Tothia fuscella]|uniref:Aminoglycoside phosphotransferase domain-containing protein n=1 Tax=Tothia fuscella TaxID=1048955 RepID=A0A9P4TUG6_9PEZI|nr:hypothetical protein EJ08DRAFT_487149 [Tothia fuscella]